MLPMCYAMPGPTPPVSGMLNFFIFHLSEMHLREGPFKDTPVMEILDSNLPAVRCKNRTRDGRVGSVNATSVQCRPQDGMLNLKTVTRQV